MADAQVTTLAGLIELSLKEQELRGLQFTPQEIAQQPDTWGATFRLFLRNQQRICKFLEDAGVRGPLEGRPTVLLVGAGTSDYIGHALCLLLRRTWGCEVAVCGSTELLPNLEDSIIPGRQYLCISFSRSGDSPEGVALIRQALQLYPEMAHLVVTCNADAGMISAVAGAARSCVIVLDDAVNDRSLAMTSSFTNMVVMGQCLAHAWSVDEYAPVLERLVTAGREFLMTAGQEASRLAEMGYRRICLVASGSLVSAAKESALKVLEMTAGQVQTMPETILGLRHGPMAALDGKVLFVCFVSHDPRRALYAADLLREVGEKGLARERVVVGPVSLRQKLAPRCECYLSVPDDVADGYRPVLDVIFGQLLGLYASIACDLKPDAPSPGGVINRVVQEFRIY